MTTRTPRNCHARETDRLGHGARDSGPPGLGTATSTAWRRRAWRDFAVDLERSLDYAGDCPIGTLGSQLAETDPDARKEVAAGFALWEKSVVDGLQAIQDRGELRADADQERLGLALLTTLQGGLLLTQIRRDTSALEAGLDTMPDHVESSLVPV